MSSQHSRRPWFLAYNRLGTETFVMANGDDGKDWTVAKVYRTTGKVEADAALIAAAPDLLAVLKELGDLHNWHMEGIRDVHGKEGTAPLWIGSGEIFERAAAAIARAEGGQL